MIIFAPFSFFLRYASYIVGTKIISAMILWQVT